MDKIAVYLLILGDSCGYICRSKEFNKGKKMNGLNIIIEHPTQGTLHMMWRRDVEAFSAMLFGFHYNDFTPNCKVVGLEGCWIPTPEHLGKSG